MWDLHCIMQDISLWCVGSVVVACGLSCSAACGILVPLPGIKPMSLALKGGLLNTRPPGKSWILFEGISFGGVRKLLHTASTCVHACMLSCFSRIWLCATPWTVTQQTPLSMGFSKWEYWSGVTFPSPWDLPGPGIEPRSSVLQADSLPSEPPGKPR